MFNDNSTGEALKITYKGTDGKKYTSLFNMEQDQGLWTIEQVVARQKAKDHVVKVLRTEKISHKKARQIIKSNEARKADCGCHLCNGVTEHDQDMNYICDECKEQEYK
jgi:hypothetical protein